MTWLSDAALAHLRAVADQPDLTGTKYELGDAIGRGGMGIVYRAVDRELGREVALKVLGAPGPDPSMAARLQLEARILARLEHPGIVPVHDVGVLPDGRWFYAMKLVRGARLDELVPRLGSASDRLRILQRLLDGVSFAHAQGIVHRDLKPQNVMVGQFGEVLVLDWGVAKVLTGSAVPAAADKEPSGVSTHSAGAATAHGTIIGTAGYMAPEQERGEVESIDERTDIYALGAIMRLLVSDTGAKSERPRALDAIWTKAMSPDPAARYPSVKALSADVSCYLDGLPVSAYPEGFFDRAGRVARKYQTAILLVAAYLIMRIVLLAVAGI